jgi:hypothetical protein
MAAECSLDGCVRHVKSHGYCDTHWKRVQRHGAPGPAQIGRTVQQRLMALTDVGDGTGCWEWHGRRQLSGYGQVWVNEQRRADPAHRVSYEAFVGPIPEGLQIDHLCRNRRCIRPDHLEPVTAAENFARSTHPAALTKKTGVCGRGHDLAVHGKTTTSGTTEITRCQECRRERERKAA